MVVVNFGEKRLERKVREQEVYLECLIKECVSKYSQCNLIKLLHYANWLENISPSNPFIHLADGVMYAKTIGPSRSYAKSVKHLNLFLKSYPLDEDAVWWRLDSATNLARERYNTYFLSKIAREAVRFFPENIWILSAAHNAYHNGVQDIREAMKVGTRILRLDPFDEQMRRYVSNYRRLLVEDEKPSNLVILRGVSFDSKEY